MNTSDYMWTYKQCALYFKMCSQDKNRIKLRNCSEMTWLVIHGVKNIIESACNEEEEGKWN